MEGVLRGRTLASCASENYLETLGITLLRGRDFTKQETATGAHVAVISESTARRFWPEDPLGKHFQLDMHFDGKLSEFEVIGIVKDVRFSNLTRTDPAHVYLATNPTEIYPTLNERQGRSARCARSSANCCAGIRQESTAQPVSMEHGNDVVSRLIVFPRSGCAYRKSGSSSTRT